MFILLALLKKLTFDTDRKAELLHQICRKNEAALSELYDLFKILLFSLCVSVFKEKDLAGELLQEFFVQVGERASSFDRLKGTPYAWLTTLSRNKATDTNDIILPLMPPQEVSPFSETVAKKRSSMMQTFLNAISGEQRTVLVGAYFEGYSQSKIADEKKFPLARLSTA